MKQYLQYIENTGGHPKTEWFDDDFMPIGPMVRSDLVRMRFVEECNGIMELTLLGSEELKKP